ncbi:cellulase family glycosylhydrolase [Salinarimonas soli]|uniref:cellulase n=1 Tax=Salinarimonas soli TaxID=1638099 RepID=A0A5B2V8W6_9HYPH|nr:cellulase family glycosylhydrolase [Salinarimonas soli]
MRLTGVNWDGFETPNMSPTGLWARNYRHMLEQMRDAGFNNVRLPFSGDIISASPHTSGISLTLNPDLAGLTPLQIMDKVIAYAGEIGLRVTLDYHRREAGYGAEPDGAWSSVTHSQDEWIANWATLAERYAGNKTVIGADLFNEPGGDWGTWSTAAEKAGAAIQAKNPDWLVFVQGNMVHNGDWYWIGGNLQGAGADPVQLPLANKVVYAPHDYPPSVVDVPFLRGIDQKTLQDLFQKNWGYIYEKNIAPVMIGEFGSRYEAAGDFPWLKTFYNYIQGDLDGNGVQGGRPGDKGMGWTIWTWGPLSGDTGGIVSSDWWTLNQAKLDDLRPLTGGLLPTSSAVASASAANKVEFTITLPQNSVWDTVYYFKTADGTAKAGSDYVAKTGVIHIPNGQNTAHVSVEVIDDHVQEGTEDFYLEIFAPWAPTQVLYRAVGSILDDDQPILPVCNIPLPSYATAGASAALPPDLLPQGGTHVNDLSASHGLGWVL